MNANGLDIPIQPHRLRRMLQRMIDIYSPSGKEEELLGYLFGLLKKYRLPVQRQALGDGRHNLIVAAPEIDIELALIGHVDTVVAYDLDHMGFEDIEGQISGLGAADMKGGCAALMEAFLTVWEAGFRQLPVALVMVVGEEEEGDGAARLMEEYHFPWALIAEPTQLAPCLAHYGYIEMQLATRGHRRHASLANQLDNPVETMLRTLLAITRHLTDHRTEGIYNIRDLLTSQSGFAVPDWCEAWMDLHLPPHTPIGEICAELEEVAAGAHNGPPESLAEIRFHTIQGGYDLPQKGPLIQTLHRIYTQRALPWQPAAFQSHSDANQLWAHGVKSILLGPGSLAKAHAPDESVAWQEVVTAAEIYRSLILQMFGQP